jgi:hypothetical protein
MDRSPLTSRGPARVSKSTKEGALPSLILLLPGLPRRVLVAGGVLKRSLHAEPVGRRFQTTWNRTGQPRFVTNLDVYETTYTRYLECIGPHGDAATRWRSQVCPPLATLRAAGVSARRRGALPECELPSDRSSVSSGSPGHPPIGQERWLVDPAARRGVARLIWWRPRRGAGLREPRLGRGGVARFRSGPSGNPQRGSVPESLADGGPRLLPWYMPGCRCNRSDLNVAVRPVARLPARAEADVPGRSLTGFSSLVPALCWMSLAVEAMGPRGGAWSGQRPRAPGGPPTARCVRPGRVGCFFHSGGPPVEWGSPPLIHTPQDRPPTRTPSGWLPWRQNIAATSRLYLTAAG